MTEELEVVRGSANPFRDADLPDADTLLLKVDLLAEIIGILRKRKLSQRKAAELTGLAQPDISRLKNADLRGFTIDRLVAVLNRLDHTVELRVKPMTKTTSGSTKGFVGDGFPPKDYHGGRRGCGS